MKKRGRKKKVVDVDKILKLLEDDKVNPYVNDIAKACKVTWITMKKIIDANPPIKEMMELRKVEIVEKAEETVMQIVSNDEHPHQAQMAKFILSVRNNAYKAKMDIEGNVDHSINITISKEDGDNLKDLMEE